MRMLKALAELLSKKAPWIPEQGVLDVPYEKGVFKKVTPEEFVSKRDHKSRGGYLSPTPAEELQNHDLYQNDLGVGYALSPEKDLQGVYNNSGLQGLGENAVINGVTRGAKTLDAFDGKLPPYYKQFGFDETNRLQFNDEYAPKNWNFERDGRPDVVFMQRPEQLPRSPKEVRAGYEEARRGLLGDSEGSGRDVLSPVRKGGGRAGKEYWDGEIAGEKVPNSIRLNAPTVRNVGHQYIAPTAQDLKNWEQEDRSRANAEFVMGLGPHPDAGPPTSGEDLAIALSRKAEGTPFEGLMKNDAVQTAIGTGKELLGLPFGRSTVDPEQAGKDITDNPYGQKAISGLLEYGPAAAQLMAMRGGQVPGSGSIKDERRKVFGKTSDPGSMKMQDKHYNTIQNWSDKNLGLDITPSRGKIDLETGNRRKTDLIPGSGKAKPDWRGKEVAPNQIESQFTNPDALVHELGHVMTMEEGVPLRDWQTKMDDVFASEAAKQKKSVFEHPDEIQARAVENPLRRMMGLPASTVDAEVAQGQAPRLDMNGNPRAIRVPGRRASDAPGTQVDLLKQSRLQTPETKARMDAFRRGDIILDPQKGWIDNPNQMGYKIKQYKKGLMNPPEPPPGQGFLPGVNNVIGDKVADASQAFRERGQQPMSPETKIQQMYHGPDVRDAMPSLLDEAKETWDYAQRTGKDMSDLKSIRGSAYNNPRNAPSNPWALEDAKMMDAERAIPRDKDGFPLTRSMVNGEVTYKRSDATYSPNATPKKDPYNQYGERVEDNYVVKKENPDVIIADKLTGPAKKPTPFNKLKEVPENVTPINDQIVNKPKGEVRSGRYENRETRDQLPSYNDPKKPGGRGPDSLNAVVAAPGGQDLNEDQQKELAALKAKYGIKEAQPSQSGELNPEQQKELDLLKAKYGVANTKFDNTGSLSDRWSKASAKIKELESDPDYHPETKDFGSHAALSKVIDYERGLLRTAAGALIGEIGGKQFITKDDMMNALDFKAPTGTEMLRKSGMPTMGWDLREKKASLLKDYPNVAKHIPDEVSGREALGFLFDLGMDKARPDGFKYTQGLAGQGIENTGRKIYNSGFKKVQATLDDNERRLGGKIAPVMEKEGFTGSMRESVPAMRKAKRANFDRVKGLLQEADNAGAQVDMNRAVQEAQDFVDDLRANRLADGTMDAHIEEMQARIDKFKAKNARPGFEQNPEVKGYDAPNELNARKKGIPYDQRITEHTPGEIPDKLKHKMEPVPVTAESAERAGKATGKPNWTVGEDKVVSLPVQGTHTQIPGPSTQKANRWKQLLYKRAGGRAYQVDASNPYATEFEKRMASGHKAAIEEAVEKTLGKEAAQKVAEHNADYGTLAESLKPTKRVARTEATPNLLSATDVMHGTNVGLLTQFLGHNPLITAAVLPIALAAKKGVQYANTTAGRTKIGKGLIDFGRSGEIDAAINRGLINSNK